MSPSYGSTPVDPEDSRAFVGGVSFATKADLYEAETDAIAAMWSAMAHAINIGQITARALCERDALISLHRGCYAGIWTWAGAYRSREMNLGDPPEMLRQSLPEAMDTIRYWVETVDDAAWIAMSAHHRLVKIHPFVDGNGRVTRLYADLLLYALTCRFAFAWEDAIDQEEYFRALREADQNYSPARLLALVPLLDLADGGNPG